MLNVWHSTFDVGPYPSDFVIRISDFSIPSPRQTIPSAQHSGAMPIESDSPLDQLWNEYSQVFREFDDLTLARWLAQTLGQLGGKAWRLSHPLLRAYALAAA